MSPESSGLPTWVLTAVIGLLVSILIAMFGFIVNRILTQNDETRKENQEQFRRLTDAVVSIDQTTAVQAKILETHTDDIKELRDIIKDLLPHVTKARR